MGWTYTNKPSGMRLKEFFTKEFNLNVIDVSASSNEAYLAVENKKGEVFGVVCLINRKGDTSFNFGYKAMGEDTHPYYYNCHKRILEKLTPIDEFKDLSGNSKENARTWREKCRETAEKKNIVKSLKVGDIIKLDKVISFRNGFEGDRFKIVNSSGKGKFQLVAVFEDGSTSKTYYTIPKLENFSFTIEK